MNDNKSLKIRNSTAEFLIFEKQSKADSIEIRYEDENLWLTQKMMAELFDVESNTITYHLKEIFASGELEQSSTTRKFRVVQKEGEREVNRDIDHYNLDAVISVGYRVNSIRATQFRRWATQIFTQQVLIMIRVHQLQRPSLLKYKTKCIMPLQVILPLKLYIKELTAQRNTWD